MLFEFLYKVGDGGVTQYDRNLLHTDISVLQIGLGLLQTQGIAVLGRCGPHALLELLSEVNFADIAKRCHLRHRWRIFDIF